MCKKGRKDQDKIKGKRKTNNLFHGIQVSVTSDEEEDMDYIDDIDKERSVGHTSDDNQNDIQMGNKSTENEMVLGASSSTLTNEQALLNNPHLKKLLDKLLDERIQNTAKNGESSSSQLLTKLTPTAVNTTKVKKGGQNKQGTKVIKSPSDTTIYVPALNRVVAGSAFNGTVLNERCVMRLSQGDGCHGDNVSGQSSEAMPNLTQTIDSSQADVLNMVVNGSNDKTTQNGSHLINKISNFVDQLRLDFEDKEDSDEDMVVQHKKPKSSVNIPGLDEAQKRMKHAIVEAEKFKAAVEKPPGRTDYFTNFEAQNSVSGNLAGGKEPEVVVT